MAQNYATQNHMSKQLAILELLSHKEARTTFRNLRQRIKPYKKSQLKTLWVAINDQGEYTKDHIRKRVYTDESAVHKQLLIQNKEHLSQALDTPFATGWLRNQLRWDGTGPLA